MRSIRLPLCLLFVWVLLAGCAGHSTLETDDTPITKGLSSQRVQILTVAKKNLGVGYKWGGNTPSEGLDCSGLAALAYHAAGYTLPRTSNDQFHHMPQVSKARPGDLMFFGSGSHANHVGIYMGNNKMIHAPGSGRRVQVTNVTYGYWQDHYLGTGSLAP
ncbi:C40 family peptidase [Carnimonas bestiolae]|uniref:C40 family peptidase n=1 Tax=Carnimonas bestiolae TaxID=3402172 RepID=UPI003EDBFC38